MRIHLAENLSNSYYLDFLRENSTGNLLFSYLTCRNNTDKVFEILDRVQGKNIIIDSGAFSAWTQNEIINIDDYIKFCKSLKTRKENFYFVNLDIIPGSFGRKPTQLEIDHSALQGWKNMEYMEANGVKVIHIFHQHEDFKWLDKLVEKQDYIGISPANDVNKKQRIIWLDTVFSKIRGSRKTHGFGATAKDIIYRYPWYSVDSTSWKAPQIYGSSCTTNLTKKGILHGPPGYMKQELVNEIKRWTKIEKEATQLWSDRGVVW